MMLSTVPADLAGGQQLPLSVPNPRPLPQLSPGLCRERPGTEGGGDRGGRAAPLAAPEESRHRQATALELGSAEVSLSSACGDNGQPGGRRDGDVPDATLEGSPRGPCAGGGEQVTSPSSASRDGSPPAAPLALPARLGPLERVLAAHQAEMRRVVAAALGALCQRLDGTDGRLDRLCAQHEEYRRGMAALGARLDALQRSLAGRAAGARRSGEAGEVVAPLPGADPPDPEEEMEVWSSETRVADSPSSWRPCPHGDQTRLSDAAASGAEQSAGAVPSSLGPPSLAGGAGQSCTLERHCRVQRNQLETRQESAEPPAPSGTAAGSLVLDLEELETEGAPGSSVEGRLAGMAHVGLADVDVWPCEEERTRCSSPCTEIPRTGPSADEPQRPVSPEGRGCCCPLSSGGAAVSPHAGGSCAHCSRRLPVLVGDGITGPRAAGGDCDGRTEGRLGGAEGDGNGRTEGHLGGAEGGSKGRTEGRLGGAEGDSDGQTEGHLGGAEGDSDGQTEGHLGGAEGDSEGQTEGHLGGAEGDSDGQAETRLGGAEGDSDGQAETRLGGAEEDIDGQAETRLGGAEGDIDGQTETRLGGAEGDSDGQAETRLGGAEGDSDGQAETRLGGAEGDSDAGTSPSISGPPSQGTSLERAPAGGEVDLPAADRGSSGEIASASRDCASPEGGGASPCMPDTQEGVSAAAGLLQEGLIEERQAEQQNLEAHKDRDPEVAMCRSPSIELRAGSSPGTDTAISPELRAGSSPERETAISPELRAGSSSEMDTSVSIELRAGSSPDTDTSVSPELRAGSSSEMDTSVSIELRAGSSPDTDTSVSPELRAGSSSEMDTSVSTELRAGSSSEMDTSVSTELRAGSSPDTDTLISPELRAGCSPERNTAISPELRAGSSPERDTAISPELRAASSPERDTAISPELRAASSPERDTAISTELRAGSSPDTDTLISPELRAGCSPERNTLISPELRAGCSPERNTAISPELRAGSSPERDTAISTELRAGSSPDTDTLISPELRAGCSPERNTLISPELRAGCSPERNTAISPELRAASSPERNTAISPELRAGSSPERDTAISTELRARSSPERDTAISPELRAASSPERDTAISPELRAGSSPERETAISPELRAASSPERDAAISPELRAASSPERETAISPELRARCSPERNTAISPELRAASSPERDTAISPELRAASSPERETAISPELRAASSPERETAISPELRAGSSPERETAISRELRAGSSSERDTAISPELRAGSSPGTDTEISPELRAASSPERETAISPELRARCSPERNTAISPELRARSSPERETAISPELRARCSPERNTAISPELRAASSPERDTAISPELRAGSSPERDTAISPELRARSSPGTDTAISPELRAGSSPGTDCLISVELSAESSPDSRQSEGGPASQQSPTSFATVTEGGSLDVSTRNPTVPPLRQGPCKRKRLGQCRQQPLRTCKSRPETPSPTAALLAVRPSGAALFAGTALASSRTREPAGLARSVPGGHRGETRLVCLANGSRRPPRVRPSPPGGIAPRSRGGGQALLLKLADLAGSLASLQEPRALSRPPGVPWCRWPGGAPGPGASAAPACLKPLWGGAVFCRVVPRLKGRPRNLRFQAPVAEQVLPELPAFLPGRWRPLVTISSPLLPLSFRIDLGVPARPGSPPPCISSDPSPAGRGALLLRGADWACSVLLPGAAGGSGPGGAALAQLQDVLLAGSDCHGALGSFRRGRVPRRATPRPGSGLRTVLALSSPTRYRLWTRQRGAGGPLGEGFRVLLSQTQPLPQSDSLLPSLHCFLGGVLGSWGSRPPHSCLTDLAPLCGTETDRSSSRQLDCTVSVLPRPLSRPALPASSLLSDPPPDPHLGLPGAEPPCPEGSDSEEEEGYSPAGADSGHQTAPREDGLSEKKLVEQPGQRSKRVSQIRIRKAVPKPDNNLTPMGLPKPKRLKKKEFSLEEIYTNKNYCSPPSNSLETIFEEPREKNGALVCIGQQKRKRMLDFPDFTLPRKRRARGGVRVRGGRGRGRRARQGDADLDLQLIERLSDLDHFLTQEGLEV